MSSSRVFPARNNEIAITPNELRRPDLHTGRSKRTLGKLVAAIAVCLSMVGAATTAEANPLPTPAMTPPLAASADPASFDLGLIGKVYVTGQASVLAMAQTSASASPYAGNGASALDVSNGQIELQTIKGPVQFYVQLGGYALPTLGAPYLHIGRSTSETYGPAPVAFLKLVPSADISFQIGALPTLIGSEYTSTFQNMNIERGLLWTQEPAISRGVQINYAHGPVLLSFSVNDGFYSGHYSSVSGLASYAVNDASTFVLAGGTNLATVKTATYVTPMLQNNSSILNVMYTYSKGPLMVNPYLQFTRVDANHGLGLFSAVTTASGAILTKYNITPHFSIAARSEYIVSSSDRCGTNPCSTTNLLYGPKSSAWSATLTPTYQQGRYFVRADISDTRITALTRSYGFGRNGLGADQKRVLIETGVLF